MSSWQARIDWIVRMLAAAAAISLCSWWGPVVLRFLIGWGPLLFLRVFGGFIFSCLAVLFALAFPAVVVRMFER